MIKSKFDTDAANFLSELRERHDELVMPIELWRAHIENNPLIKRDDIPLHKFSGEWVITEREWFGAVISGLSHLYYHSKRLTKEQGGFWIVEILEPKKEMPKHDLFEVGQRQPGSFGSNG